MKPISQVYFESDIDDLIKSNAEESHLLEFKRAEALTSLLSKSPNLEDKKIEIARDVSAFANSNGGILIYGIEEKDHKAKAKSFVDGRIFTKERLEQLIADKIERRMEFTIDPIRCDDDLSKSIYVVRIPKSKNKPHQVIAEGSYYKRDNYRKVRMTENEVREHYLIQNATDLEILEPVVKQGGISTRLGKLSDFTASVEFHIRNVGENIEQMYKLEIGVPISLVRASYSGGNHPFFDRSGGTSDDYSIFSFPSQNAIFRDEITLVTKTQFRITEANVLAVLSNPIKMKLYYSSGSVQRDFLLAANLKHEGHTLSVECFKSNRQ